MADRVEHIGAATLYLGDCRDILPTLGKVDAVVSDPPYGMKWSTKTARFSGGTGGQKRRCVAHDVVDDDKPFDPSPWLTFPKVVLWGANHFAQHLPVGTSLIWLKKYDNAFGTFLSDAEIAWMKGGRGVYCRRDLSLHGESANRLHPTQKPVGLMEWCIQKVGAAEVILDPYMGSGTTGVASLNLGRRFVGCEVDPIHFDNACRRIEQAQRQGSLFGAEAAA